MIGRGSRTGRETAHAVVAHDSMPNPLQVSILGLTPDQVQRLLTLIDILKGGYGKLSGKLSWMIDYGASCHMTCDLSLIDEVKNI